MSADLFIERNAEFGAAGASTRFKLGRVWDRRLPMAGWLMCNPSIANAQEDDPTIRRCVKFSIAAGCGSLEVVNIWPLITPYPADLWRMLAAGDFTTAMAQDNAAAILDVGTRSGVKFLAFGVEPLKRDPLIAGHFVKLFTGGEPALVLGQSPEGFPLHPLARGKLAIRKDAVPYGWRWPAVRASESCRGCKHWSQWLPNVGDCMFYCHERLAQRIKADDCSLSQMAAAAVHGDFICPDWERRAC